MGSGDRERRLDTLVNASGMRFVRIPAGEFVMGASEPVLSGEELPQHNVRISRPFLMGQTPVTQGQWELVLDDGWRTPWTDYGVLHEHVLVDSDVPANYVSWDDAVRFCEALTARERAQGRLQGLQRYRLPTEAEWEYACRAGTVTSFSCGENDHCLRDHAWFAKNAYDVDEAYPHPVGLKKPNAWGLLDMHGNVEEWCSDWYDEDYYSHSPLVDPTGPDTGTHRVLRGGSWDRVSYFCRSAARASMPPDIDDQYRAGCGFRVVCEL